MYSNAEFLIRLSSNAYEFDKREMCFHLRKSVVGYCNGWYAATVREANCHAAKTICGGETPCERVYFTGRSWINYDNETRS